MLSPDSTLEEPNMHGGRFVFAQLLDSLPRYEFNKCVERYRGNHRARTFSCYDQFLTMAFAQLANRESLRDIEICLKAMDDKLYHIGFRCNIAKRQEVCHLNKPFSYPEGRPLRVTGPPGASCAIHMISGKEIDRYYLRLLNLHQVPHYCTAPRRAMRPTYRNTVSHRSTEPMKSQVCTCISPIAQRRNRETEIIGNLVFLKIRFLFFH